MGMKQIWKKNRLDAQRIVEGEVIEAGVKQGMMRAEKGPKERFPLEQCNQFHKPPPE